MDYKYNVLWIEDEIEKHSKFIKRGKQFNLNINHFKTVNLGVTELKNNLEKYDAIILDAVGFVDSDINEKASDQAIYTAKTNIDKLNVSLPLFIFTGHFDESILRNYKNDKDYEVFNKSDGPSALFQSIVKKVEEYPTTKLKKKYAPTLALAEMLDAAENEDTNKQYSRLLELLDFVDNEAPLKNPQDKLTPIRKIIEAIFKKFYSIGLLPDEVLESSINGRSSFISGKHNDYHYQEAIIQPYVANQIWFLLQITQDGSHEFGHQLRADNYVANNKLPHAFLAVFHAFIDVSSYLIEFFNANENKEENLKKWSKIVVEDNKEIVSGEVIRVAHNGYGIFKSDKLDNTIGVLDSLMNKHSLVEGSKLNITTKPSPCGTKTYIDAIIEVINP